MSEQTAGSWQPDPSGANDYRWHDGKAFTNHVSNAGVVGQAPMGQRAENAPAGATQAAAAQSAGVQAAGAQAAGAQAAAEQSAAGQGFAAQPAQAGQAAGGWGGAVDTDGADPVTGLGAGLGQYTGGITGELLGTGDADSMVKEADVVSGRFLKCLVSNTPILARQGSMVAYQGNIDFNYQGQGMGNLFKKAITGEGVPLMRMTGQGEVYLAQQGQKVHIVHLNNTALSINGSNVLAFSASLEYNIEIIKGGAIAMAAGGLVNTVFKGTGWLAFSTDGDPMVLNAAEAPTFADTNALVGWSAGLQASVKSSFKAGALIGRGSGEMFQAHFAGQGFVIVQPSEGIYHSVSA